MSPAPFRVRLLVVACLLAAIASLVMPISWRDYAHYVIARFGWPFVAALLTAVAGTSAILFTAKRRKTSVILAASMFISVVMHMLIVYIFDLMVVRNTITQFTVKDTRREISFSLPSLAESLISQDVRSKFLPTTMPDPRQFESASKPRTEPVEKLPERLQPQLNPVELHAPAPEKSKPTFTSKTKPVAKEELAALPAKAPDVSQANIAVIKQIPNANDAPLPPRAALQNIGATPAPRERADLLIDTHAERRMAVLKDAQREPLRKRMDVAPRQPVELAVREIMRDATLTAMRDELKLSDAQTPARAEVKPSRLEPKRTPVVFEHAAQIEEAPVPDPAARVLITAVPRADTASLAADAPARMERRPTVNDPVTRKNGRRQDPLMEAVRLQDTLAGITGNDHVEPDQTPLQVTRETFNTDRISTPLPDGNLTIQAKSKLDMKSRPVENRTLVASRSESTVPARANRPAVQAQLAKVMRQNTVDQPMLNVGRNVEVPHSAGTDAAPHRITQLPDGKMAQALSKVETGLTDGSIGHGERHSAPATHLILPLSPEAVPYDMTGLSLLQRQAAIPEADEQLALAPGSRSYFQPTIMGEDALTTSTDFGLAIADSNVVVVPAGRYKLATTKSQGDTSPAEIITVPTERPLGERSAAVSHNSLVNGSLGAVFNGEARSSIAARNPLSNGGAAETERARATLATLVPVVLTAVKDDSRETMVAGSGESRTGVNRAEIRIGKAEGIRESGTEQWRPHISAQTSGRGTEMGVTERSDISSITPAPEARTRGVGGSTIATMPATFAVRPVPVAIGLSIHEAVFRAGYTPEVAPTASGPSALSDVNVSKANGQAVPDAVMSGADSVVDATGLSLSASRPPTRMEWAMAGGPTAQTEVHTDLSVVARHSAVGRTIISAKFSGVPESVPEKAIYKLRAPERRRAFIKELGGTDQTEQAMERALEWLAKAQSDDGRWDVDGFKTLAQCGGPGDRKDGDSALTGLCLLSYLGAGYTHVKGEHKETVRKALNWLVDGQTADGNLQRDGQMYGQAMAAAALCECYSMTGDERLRVPVERAVGFILKSQNPGAGWRYLPRQDSDTSVTGWQVLALKSAMIAGIPFPPEHFQWVEAWLDKVRRGREGGLYAYMPGNGATPTMTAEGWFCQLLMSEQVRMRGQAETIPFLMEHTPVWLPKERSVNIYYWYYATLALHMSGAAEFKSWNQDLTKALLAGQVRSGFAAGSWDPVCVLGERGGRVYSTVMAALCLEVYYRYLPFYKQK